MTRSGSRSLSVVIMTFNEERNLGRCLESVQSLADEMLVLDSYSTDQTESIARSHGARFHQHPFDTYAEQRRRMIRMASYDWILMLDADECLSDQLVDSIRLALRDDVKDAYTSNRKSCIHHTWIHHGSWYPDRKIRLFDRGKVTVEGDDVHESLVLQQGARMGHLQGDLLHYADENIHARFEKVNMYTTRAAKALFQRGSKTNLARIGLKPCIRFFSSYVYRLGFLDGYYGYIIARSEAIYVWQREVKLWELNKAKVKGQRG